jgi:type I restriction enzyme S subunit
MSEYPSDWRVLPLGEVAEVVGGGTPSRDVPAFWGNDHYWITPSEVVAKDGQTADRSKEQISDLGLQSSGAKLHPPGTILMTSRASIGFAAITQKEICTNQGFQSLRCGNELDNWFALHQIRHRRAELHQLAAGSTFLEVSGSNVRSFPFILPPLPEQKKIAEILSGIDLRISNAKVKVEKCRHLLNGIINQLMAFGTRGRKVIETDAGSFPENWRIGKVEDFFTLGRGRVISIPYIKEHPGPYPVFSSQSKNNGEMGRMDTYDFDGDYFTWTTDGAYAGSVFFRSGKFNCTNVCGTGKAKSSNEANPEFASYFLQRVAKRHVSYVGNPKLMNNIFAEIPFALPPVDEQEEITQIIDSARKNIESIEEQISSLSNLKVSISADLLSGRKRVSV